MPGGGAGAAAGGGPTLHGAVGQHERSRAHGVNARPEVLHAGRARVTRIRPCARASSSAGAAGRRRVQLPLVRPAAAHRRVAPLGAGMGATLCTGMAGIHIEVGVQGTVAGRRGRRRGGAKPLRQFASESKQIAPEPAGSPPAGNESRQNLCGASPRSEGQPSLPGAGPSQSPGEDVGHHRCQLRRPARAHPPHNSIPRPDPWSSALARMRGGGRQRHLRAAHSRSAASMARAHSPHGTGSDPERRAPVVRHTVQGAARLASRAQARLKRALCPAGGDLGVGVGVAAVGPAAGEGARRGVCVSLLWGTNGWGWGSRKCARRSCGQTAPRWHAGFNQGAHTPGI